MKLGPFEVTDLPVDDDQMLVNAAGLACECGQRVFIVFATKETLFARCVVCGMTFVIK